MKCEILSYDEIERNEHHHQYHPCTCQLRATLREANLRDMAQVKMASSCNNQKDDDASPVAKWLGFHGVEANEWGWKNFSNRKRVRTRKEQRRKNEERKAELVLWEATQQRLNAQELAMSILKSCYKSDADRRTTLHWQ